MGIKMEWRAFMPVSTGLEAVYNLKSWYQCCSADIIGGYVVFCVDTMSREPGKTKKEYVQKSSEEMKYLTII